MCRVVNGYRSVVVYALECLSNNRLHCLVVQVEPELEVLLAASWAAYSTVVFHLQLGIAAESLCGNLQADSVAN